MRGLGTDHVISGPMTGLKKLHLMTQEDRQTDRQTDGQTDRQTDRKTDRQTDRQTDSHTDRLTDRHDNSITESAKWGQCNGKHKAFNSDISWTEDSGHSCAGPGRHFYRRPLMATALFVTGPRGIKKSSTAISTGKTLKRSNWMFL